MEKIRRAAGAFYEHLFAKDKKLARKKFKAMEEIRRVAEDYYENLPEKDKKLLKNNFNAMEEIRRVAEAYYEHLPENDKKLLENKFNAMDKNRDGQISLREYMKYFKKEKPKGFNHQSIFRALDKDDNGSLDFEEAKVLFYIMKSGRAITCMSCNNFIAGAYFSCSQCFFNGAESKFDICCDCYGSGKKITHHGDAIFCDNYTLLSQSRSLALAAPAEKRRGVLGKIEKIVGVVSFAVTTAGACIIM